MAGDSTSRETARVRALRWFRRHESGLLASLTAAVVLLTFSGYAFDPRLRASTPLSQAVYDSIKSVAGGVEWGAYGWQGDTANWLDLVLIAWVAAKAAIFAFSSGADAVRARWRRDHTVLCGLGERGRTIGEALVRSGEKLTVIEADRTNTEIPVLRAQGACVVVGDARNERVLLTARVDRASRVVCLLGTDDQNALAARAASRLAGDSRPRYFVHNSSPSTWSAVFGSSDDLLTPFSVLDSACSDIVLALDLESAVGPVDLDVFGTGPAAESIVARAAKVWQAILVRTRRTDALRIRITGVDATGLVVHVLPLRYPGLDRLCSVLPNDVTSYEAAEHIATHSAPDGWHPSAALIVADDDAITVRMALSLAHNLPSDVRVIALTKARSALLDMASDEGVCENGRLTAVSVDSILSDPAIILGGAREELARLAHEDWLRSRIKAGETVGGDCPLRHWEDLPEPFKASNRGQTAAIFDTVLPRLGASVVPLAEWDARAFEFDPTEVEELARLEHERWCAERRRSGWGLDTTLGERDATHKRTPWLVLYDELPEEQKGNDRDAVTRIPVLLAQAGFRIRRSTREKPGCPAAT